MICATTPCPKLENLEGGHSVVTEDSGGFFCSNKSGNNESTGAHRARGTIVAIDSLNSALACSVIHRYFSLFI